MKKKVLISIAVFCLFLQGCVPSLHPLYTAETISFDENLLGTWRNNDNKNTSIEERDQMIFSKTKDKQSYQVDYTTDGITNGFLVHLVKLGKYYYLDFEPNDDNELEINNFMAFHLIAAHTFTKIKIDKNEMAFQTFNPDWLSEQIKNRYIRIKHENLGNDQIVITASTKDLQKFVKKYADHQSGDEAAFMEPSMWKKIK